MFFLLPLQESIRCSVVLGDASLSPKSLGLSLECQGQQLPAPCWKMKRMTGGPTATSSLLEDEEDAWSGTYQPSAVEEAHLARTPSISLSSAFDSFCCDSSHLPAPPPWQLRDSDCCQHDPLDEETVEGGFSQPLQPSYEEVRGFAAVALFLPSLLSSSMGFSASREVAGAN